MRPERTATIESYAACTKNTTRRIRQNRARKPRLFKTNNTNMQNEYGCGNAKPPIVQSMDFNCEPLNVNTFNGFVKHYFPRQVVKVRLDGHDLSGTVRKVHIDDNDDITYDIEIWAFDGFIVKDIHADLVFIQNFNQ